MGGLKTNLYVEGLDEAIEKINRYLALLKEANSLAYELASIDLEMKFVTDERLED